MNNERLEKIAKWLEAGAPEVAFDMHEGVADAQFYRRNGNAGENLLTGIAKRNNRTEPECGTVCCIAGAAYLMSKAPEGRMFPSPEAQLELMTVRDCGDDCAEPEEFGRHADWMHVDEDAREWLEPDDVHEEIALRRLFDMSSAPNNCTPAQAAEAVRRVMAGQQPWPKF